jgi:prenyltransferase beta subunit
MLGMQKGQDKHACKKHAGLLDGCIAAKAHYGVILCCASAMKIVINV